MHLMMPHENLIYISPKARIHSYDLQCIWGGSCFTHASIPSMPGGESPRGSPPFTLAAASSSYRSVTVSGDSIASASMIIGLCG